MLSEMLSLGRPGVSESLHSVDDMFCRETRPKLVPKTLYDILLGRTACLVSNRVLTM